MKFLSLIVRRCVGPSRLIDGLLLNLFQKFNHLHDYQCMWSGYRGSVCGFLIFWLQIVIGPFALFHHSVFDYRCFIVMFQSCGRGLLCGQNIYLSQCTTKPTIRRATSEDSDQPAHARCLIRVFADRKCLPQPPWYQKRDKWDPCHNEWMYRVIWVFVGHTDLIVSFVVRCLICNICGPNTC